MAAHCSDWWIICTCGEAHAHCVVESVENEGIGPAHQDVNTILHIRHPMCSKYKVEVNRNAKEMKTVI